MNFNPEVTLGNIFTICAFTIGVLSAYYGLKARSDVFAKIIEHAIERMDRMERRHEERMTQGEENHRSLREIVDRMVGERDERRLWDGRERRSH
jgi:hypothetical protein